MIKRGVFLSSLVAIIFATMFLLTACGDDDETGSIKLNKSSILIPSNGESESIEINASNTWEVRNTPDWITVTPTAGENIAQVVIVVDRNRESERRKATITFVCGDAIQTLEIEQLSILEDEDTLTVSENTISATNFVKTKTVKIVATHDWKLESLPTWIHANKMLGTGNSQITLIIDENIEPDGRSAVLTFSSATSNATININQMGLKDISLYPFLPIFTQNEYGYTDKQSLHKETNSFDIMIMNQFINPSIKDQIFLGNLISPTWDTNTNMPTFTGYTFNPITVSSSAVITGDVVKTFTPSLSEQTSFANYIFEKKPRQGESFKSDSGTISFYSHKSLYALGMINIGIKLDELLYGSSYLQSDMPKKYGFIFSFKSILFSLTMDYPEKLTKENLKSDDQQQGVSYVSNVYYGKVGLLVVETDTYSDEVRAAINKVISSQTLTNEESNYIATSDINYVFFNSNKEPQVIKGGMDAINAYKESMKTATSDIYPVEFDLADYETHTQSKMSFTINLPSK